MEQVKASPQLSEVVQITKIKESFVKWSAVLEDVNKSLNTPISSDFCKCTKYSIFPSGPLIGEKSKASTLNPIDKA